MSQRSNGDNDYRQGGKWKRWDFNGCNKETPVTVYSEVKLAQTIVNNTKTLTKSDSFTSFTGEVFYYIAQRAIQTQGLNNHKVEPE